MTICSIILAQIEPEINNFGDGIWYCFVAFTTIGFGDIVVKTLVGRIITILVSIYGILIIALITGVIVNYYQEFIKIKEKGTIESFMDKLERLPELSKKELEEISQKVKERKYKI